MRPRDEGFYIRRRFNLSASDPALYSQLIEIARLVGRHTKFDHIRLRSPHRDQKTAMARHLAIYFCRALTPASFPQLGIFFSRDHSTIIHGYRVIQNRIATQPEFARFVERLRAEIEPKKEQAAA